MGRERGAPNAIICATGKGQWMRKAGKERERQKKMRTMEGYNKRARGAGFYNGESGDRGNSGRQEDANPKAGKLTGSRNSQVRKLQSILMGLCVMEMLPVLLGQPFLESLDRGACRSRGRCGPAVWTSWSSRLSHVKMRSANSLMIAPN